MLCAKRSQLIALCQCFTKRSQFSCLSKVLPNEANLSRAGVLLWYLHKSLERVDPVACNRWLPKAQEVSVRYGSQLSRVIKPCRPFAESNRRLLGCAPIGCKQPGLSSSIAQGFVDANGVLPNEANSILETVQAKRSQFSRSEAFYKTKPIWILGRFKRNEANWVGQRFCQTKPTGWVDQRLTKRSQFGSWVGLSETNCVAQHSYETKPIW